MRRNISLTSPIFDGREYSRNGGIISETSLWNPHADEVYLDTPNRLRAGSEVTICIENESDDEVNASTPSACVITISDQDEGDQIPDNTPSSSGDHSSNIEQLDTASALQDYLNSLFYYFKTMYCIGMCPYYPGQAMGATKGCHKLQKVMYGLFVLMSVLQVPATIKYYAVDFMRQSSGEKYKLGKLIELAFNLAQAVTQLYFTYFIAFRWGDVTHFVTEVTTNMTTCCKADHMQKLNQKNKNIGIGLATAGVVVTLLGVAIGFNPISSISFKRTFQLNAYFAAETLLDWDPVYNVTKKDALWDTYARTLKFEGVLLACLRMLGLYCGWLRDHMLQDFVILVAASVGQAMTCLIEIIQKPVNNQTTSQTDFEHKWDHYHRLRQLADQMNDSFATIFSLMHVNMLLLLVYFLLQLLQPEQLDILSYLIIFDVIKAITIYYEATKIASQNKLIQAWAQDFCSRRCNSSVAILGDYYDSHFIMYDVISNPIGLGRNEFFIDTGFALKGLTSVTGLFLLLADFKY